MASFYDTTVGQQVESEGSWSNVPCFGLREEMRRLKLFFSWARSDNYDWASPSVREC